MKLSSIFNNSFGKSEDFTIGEDEFSSLRIDATKIQNFYYFYDQTSRRLIKQFVLLQGEKVDYVCQVTLIKKDEFFTPRLALSVRDKQRKIITVDEAPESDQVRVKASVNLKDCHENFWKLISFLQSLREVQVPLEQFSLVSRNESDIVAALRGRDPVSVVSIIKQLSSADGVKLSDADVDQLLKRKDRLVAFERGLTTVSEESKWQTFFERNKWIFGYGLNYQILKQEQSQPHYGGTKVDGKGGQRGDYLASTAGDVRFTVLVEIKSPATRLLRGNEEIRSGAWSLSHELTDALTQIEANMDKWDKQGAITPENRDSLESQGIYTVQPKGIIVIGRLSELDSRSKRETFQRFRAQIHGIDILTFDELYARAKFIVESKE